MTAVGFLSLWAIAGASWADTAVNTYTTGDQSRSAVAADGQGRFIVVWVSSGQDGDGTGIFGRRFGSDGQPIGDELLINEVTAGNQGEPQVSADDSGNFIVVWQGPGSGSNIDIFGRRFDSSGSAIGPDFQINENTAVSQRTPAVALADDGSFLTVWSNSEELVGRHFDDASAPTTGDFTIAFDDSYGPNGFRSFHRRDVEALPAGDFVIVWHDHLYTGYNYSYYDMILGAVIDSQSTQVTTFNAAAGSPAEQQRAPALAAKADGGFVVVWGGYTNYAGNSRVLGRRFSSSATPQGSLFDPTPAGDDFLRPAAISAVGEDRFLVVWNDPEIEGRFLDASGTPLTDPFAINTEQAGSDTDPQIAADGRVALVTWTQDDGGSAMDEVVAAAQSLLFLDGFESGDTGAWSETVALR
ncbi:MAG: hypothetical protein AAF560_01285 [Acidobacteriota bacterium]